jgi:uncharacterized protein YndB with AHSA1/START domain
MTTRKHAHQIDLDARPQRVFSLLITPSAIRGWWGASRAIVVAKPNGSWNAAWGPNEDDPEYVTTFRLRTYDPPRRLVFADAVCFAKSGSLPFDADFVTAFTIEPRAGGCTLRVVQDGFPLDPVADAFYAACEVGWKNTFEGIKRFVAETKTETT